MKVRVPWFARLLISLGILLVLCLFVPFASVWSAIRYVPVSLAAGVLAGFLLGHVVAAFKWWWLISQHATVPWRLALRAHFAGLMANLCLPGLAGGDVVRAAWVMKHCEGRTGIAVASAADRLLDCVGLLLLAGLGVLWTSERTDQVGRALLWGTAAVLLVVVAMLLAYHALRRWTTTGLLTRLSAALGELVGHPTLLLRTLLLSLCVQGSFIGLNVCLGQATGVEAPAAAWLVAWPLAKLLALVPLSLNGLGVREAALVFFMRPFGASAAAVTAASLLWQALLAVGGLAGGLVAVALQAPTQVAREEPALS